MAAEQPPPDGRGRLRTAVARSRLSRAVLASRTAALLGRARRWTTGCRRRLARAAETSRLTGAAGTAGDWVRGSALYRWLTAEPDPEVVVIDLRETYTVGPVIALLDRVADPLGRSYRRSGLCGLVDRLDAAAERAAGTRAGRLVARALAPPEPPAEPAGRESADEPAAADADGEEAERDRDRRPAE